MIVIFYPINFNSFHDVNPIRIKKNGLLFFNNFTILNLRITNCTYFMLIIGIAGGSGSGKTTVVKKIIERLPKDSVAVVSGKVNLDHNQR